MAQIIPEKTMNNVGIIGSGNMALDMAKAFKSHGKFLIKTICDIDLAKARALADAYNCQFTNDFRVLLVDPSLDLIYIATPPKTHAELFISSLSAKKHTLLEKPLCLTDTEAKAMLNAAFDAEKNGVVSAINYPMAFIPGLRAMKELLSKAGSIKHVDLKLHFPTWPRPGLNFSAHDWINSKESGGILREISCHYLFAMEELFLGSIKRICSLISYPKVGSETGVSGIIEHEGFNTSVSIAANYCGLKEEIYLRVYSESLTLSLENFQILKVSSPKELKAHESAHGIDEQAFMSSDPLVKQLALAIDGQKNTLPSIATGARVQRLLNALLLSKGDWVEISRAT